MITYFTTPRKIWFLVLCLAACLFLPAVHAANTVLLDDQFTDDDRNNQSLPASARWFYVGEAEAARRLAIPGGGSPELRMEADGDYAQIFGYFTASGSPRTLAVGDSLKLTLRLRLSRLYNQSAGIRFGLFNANGVRATADSSDNVYGNTYVGYRGYFVGFNPGASSTFEIRRRFESTGHSPLLSGGSTVAASASGVNVGLAANTLFIAELTFTRTAADTMTIVTRVNGVELSATDTAIVATAFDTIGLIHGNGMPVGEDIRIESALIDYTPSGGAAQQIVNESFIDRERVTLSPPASLAWFYRGTTTTARLPGRLTILEPGYAAPAGNKDVILQSEAQPSAALAYFTTAGSPVSLAVGEAMVLRASLRFDGARRAPIRLALLNSGGSRPSADQEIATGVPAAGLFSGYRGHGLVFDPSGSGTLRAEARTGNATLPAADAAFASLGQTTGTAPLHGGSAWTTVSLRVVRVSTGSIRIEGVGADANVIAVDAAAATTSFDTVLISTAGAAGASVVLRIDDVLVARSTPDGNASGPGTILSENFNTGSPWPARAAVAGGAAAGRVQALLGEFGTFDTLGTLVPGAALRLAVDAPSGAAWSAALDSGPLTVSNSLADLARITLAFDLRVSRPRPVRVKLTSLVDGAALERVVYPAAADFHQRFAFELSDMVAAGGVFHPVNSLSGQVRLAFEIVGGPDEVLGWPGGEHTLDVDNVHLARPRFYVSPSGVDTASGGGESNPFASIQYAADRTNPGDIVLIRQGAGAAPHYIVSSDPNSVGVTLGRAGVPSGWVTFKNYPGERPVIRNGGWGIFRVGRGTGPSNRNRQNEAAYLELRGLELRGVASIIPEEQRGTFSGPSNTNGIAVEGRHSAIRPHHLRFADLTVTDAGGAGIITTQADYVAVEGCWLEDNSTTNIYGMSGLSIYGGWDYAGPPNTYRKLVAGVRATNNRSVYPWADVGRLSDGNGIIIDCNLNTQFNSVIGPYPGRTLVQNNLAWRNGGSGLHAFLCRRVDFVNNTAFANSRTFATGYGEMFSNASDDIRFLNNIMVATDGRPLSFVWNTESRPATLGTAFYHTLYRGGTLPAGNGTLGPTSTGNAAPSGTFFVNANGGDLRIRVGSPAIDFGLTTLYAPAADAAGRPRGADGVIDAGALERQPVILRRPPSSLVLAPGQTATLSVEAMGDALTYQWTKDNAPIAGATAASYALPPAGAGTPGVYRVVVTSEIDSFTSAGTTVTVQAADTPHEAWRRGFFGTPEPTGAAADDADPDGDGLVNLLEYALGRHPQLGDAAGAFALEAASGGSGGGWEFVFVRAAEDLDYFVERSSDLVSWTVIATNPGVVTQAQSVRVPVPAPNVGAGETRVFVRLRVAPR